MIILPTMRRLRTESSIFSRTLPAAVSVSALCLAVGIGIAPAHAQNAQDINPNYYSYLRVSNPLPKTRDNGTSVPEFPHQPAIFPDPWGGLSWLRRHGVAFQMQNTNELAGAVTQPTPGFVNYRQGTSNAGQVSTLLHMNWETLAGIKGFATHVVFTSRYGTTSNRMLGDWLGHTSEIYGGGGNVVVHLVAAYGEETLMGGRLSIAAGRMPESNDFSASPLFCNFQNNNICGRPHGFTDNPYITSYPSAEWGFRARYRPTRFTYVQTGLFFAERGVFANPQHRTGFKFNGSNIVGQIAPVELGWEPLLGRQGKLPGHYKVGAQLISAPTADNYFDVGGLPLAMTHRTAQNHDQTWSTWLETDQNVWRPSYAAAGNGMTLIGGMTYNNPRTALRQFQLYFGAINRGFIKSRPQDAFNFMVTYIRIAPGVSATDALYIRENQYNRLPNHATGVQSYAVTLETNYQIHVMRGFLFQPSAQVYINPNGQQNLRTGMFLGFKTLAEIF